MQKSRNFLHSYWLLLKRLRRPTSRFFLGLCADPNVRDVDGHSALHLLVSSRVVIGIDRRNRKTSALALLAHGADVNATGSSALVTAAHHGHIRAAKTFRHHGPDLNYRHEIYGTALETAKRSKREKMIRLLIEAHNCQHPMPTWTAINGVHSFYVLCVSVVFAFGYASFVLCAVGFHHLCLWQYSTSWEALLIRTT